MAYGTISDPNAVEKTATEIASSKQRSYATIVDAQKALQGALTQLLWAMDVWATIGRLAPRGAYQTAFTFDDSVVVDTDARFQQDMRLVQAGLMSKVEFRIRNFKESEAVAKQKITKKRKASSSSKRTCSRQMQMLVYNRVVEGTEEFLFANREPSFTVTPDSLDKNRQNVDGGSLRIEDNMKISGVYEIVNKVNGHRYIGSSANIAKRWRETTTRDLNGLKHHSVYLQRAWLKYGPDCFAFAVIENCEKSSLVQREQFYINELKPAYNTSPTAGMCPLGVKHTDETKRKVSEAGKGRVFSDVHKRRIGDALKNRTFSPETRALIGAKSKGRVFSGSFQTR